MTVLSPGIHDVPGDAYHADTVADRPSLSNSIVQILLTQSPAHARHAHPRLNPDYQRVDKEQFALGTAAHALLLEGNSDDVVVLDFDHFKTKAAREAREAAYASGKTPMLARHWRNAQDMVEAIIDQLKRHEAAPTPFTNGKPEQTLTWTDAGVLCRARIDWLHDGNEAISDLKTTAIASPEAWTRSMFSAGKDVQAAFYLRGLKAVTGKDAEFRFVVVETSPPHALSIVSLAPSALALANDKIDRALSVWRRCLETDVWPGYIPKVAYVDPPVWAEMQWLEKEAREMEEEAA